MNCDPKFIIIQASCDILDSFIREFAVYNGLGRIVLSLRQRPIPKALILRIVTTNV